MPKNTETDEPTEAEVEAITGPYAGSSVDPLAALLAIDVPADADITRTFDVPVKSAGERTTIPWTVGVVTNTMLEECRDAATSWVRKPGARRERVQELDNAKFNRLLIVEATRSPDLRDPRLVARFGQGTRSTDEMLDRILLPGTITKLGDSVLDLSGFDDEELRAEGKG